MGLYDGIKDVAKVMQQADNVELYLKLLDLGKQALDMQEEILRLQEESCKLKKYRELEDVIVRHEVPVITRRDDKVKIYYCAHCWENEGKLFQIRCSESGEFTCPHCRTMGTYDHTKEKAYNAEIGKSQVIY